MSQYCGGWSDAATSGACAETAKQLCRFRKAAGMKHIPNCEQKLQASCVNSVNKGYVTPCYAVRLGLANAQAAYTLEKIGAPSQEDAMSISNGIVQTQTLLDQIARVTTFKK